MKEILLRDLDGDKKRGIPEIVVRHQNKYKTRSAAAAVEDIIRRYPVEIAAKEQTISSLENQLREATLEIQRLRLEKENMLASAVKLRAALSTINLFMNDDQGGIQS